ncbi:MAG: transporter [Verrucomicrobia bacterium]|nr:transporter [Verrucomicrobiota bacterium]
MMTRAVCVTAILATSQLRADDQNASPSPTPDKSSYTIFNPTPISSRRAFNTDRPTKTDSPFTIDAGVFQLENDLANWTLDYQHAVRTRTWVAGNSNFKLGLTNWMDVQVFPEFYVNTRTSGPAFARPVEHSGFGDTTVRLKINLAGNDSGKLIVGFVSSLKIPTNSDHLANHVWEPGFGLPMNYTLPGGFTLFAQTRIDVLDQHHSSAMRVQWQNPVGILRKLVGQLSGYVEFYDAVSTGKDQPWVGSIDTGVIYQVTADFAIDANSFFGVSRAAPEYNVFIGFARRF